MYNCNQLEDILFSMILHTYDTKNVNNTDSVSAITDYITSFDNKDMFDTYDEYYEDVDVSLEENNGNFFFDDPYNEYDLFSCNGILDDDDLLDYDNIIINAGDYILQQKQRA